MASIDELERRLRNVEETENVKRFMARIARWMDRCEFTKDPADFKYFSKELLTEDGRIDTVFGHWGPDKQEIAEQFAAFSEEIGWAVHYYFHPEVDLDLDAGTAHFHAVEMVPLTWKGKATWLLLENDSDLKKVDGTWKLSRYGLEELKVLGNTEEKWADIPRNPKSWMFSNP